MGVTALRMNPQDDGADSFAKRYSPHVVHGTSFPGFFAALRMTRGSEMTRGTVIGARSSGLPRRFLRARLYGAGGVPAVCGALSDSTLASAPRNDGGGGGAYKVKCVLTLQFASSLRSLLLRRFAHLYIRPPCDDGAAATISECGAGENLRHLESTRCCSCRRRITLPPARAAHLARLAAIPPKWRLPGWQARPAPSPAAARQAACATFPPPAPVPRRARDA